MTGCNKSPNPLKYNGSFSKEVYHLESGSYVKVCMQCGVCVVSCATRQDMDYTPRKLFQMIRAGKKEEVMKSNTMWMCTSCCTCKARCPRGIPIVDVMHDLKSMAIKQGYVSYPQAAFYQAFWQEVLGRGRVFEGGVTARFFLKRGLGDIMKAFGMKDIGLSMLKHGRMPLVPPKTIKGMKDLRKIVEKAQELQQKEVR
ncbi:MAG: 4Fe-4S dicluster domain-containing protein [Bacillota bacterium]